MTTSYEIYFKIYPLLHKDKNRNKICNYLGRLMHHLPIGYVLRNASLDDSVTV